MFQLPEYAQYIITIALAFLVSFLVTPVVRRLALKAGVLDVPDNDRRIHKIPIAKMGGIAIAIGFFAVLILNVVLKQFGIVKLMPPNPQLTGLVIGLLLIMVMGFLDDLFEIHTVLKFAFQFLAAGIVIFSGTQISSFTNPFMPTGWIALNPIVSVVLTLIWIVGITNAINFIDGLDGLAGGVSAISLLSIFVISIIMGTRDMLSVSILVVALAGAILGFLPYNINPAKIFMTDIGSNFIGFALAVISIQGALKSYAAVALAIPILAFGIPLFDVAFAIVRRVKHKRKITDPDRGHLHHRLLDLGFSQKQVVFILYIVSALMGGSAIVFIMFMNKRTSGWDSIGAIILILIVSVLLTIGVKFISYLSTKKDEAQDQDSEPIGGDSIEKN
ncbi:MAG: MraY family glycosyltransferase [Clostridia bacterium]